MGVVGPAYADEGSAPAETPAESSPPPEAPQKSDPPPAPPADPPPPPKETPAPEPPAPEKSEPEQPKKEEKVEPKQSSESDAADEGSDSNDGTDEINESKSEGDDTEAKGGESDEADAPFLRWIVVDEEGTLQPGVTLSLQGPRPVGTLVDDDTLWAGMASATVEDNQGQAGYMGADLDPAPGHFLVESVTDENGIPRDVGETELDRARPQLAPEGFAIGDEATWSGLTSRTDTAAAAEILVLEPAAPPMVIAARGTGEADIIVHKEVLRETSSFLQGATFNLYSGGSGGPTTKITASWANCTIGAPPATSCTITVPSNQTGNRFWVVEEAPVAGSPAASTFALGHIATGPASGDLDSPREYPGRTPTVNANTDVNVPVSGSGDTSSIGKTTNALKNRDLAQSCSTGLKVGLVLDRSSSIEAGSERNNYGQAIYELVTALITPGDSVSITPIMFNSSASAGTTQVASTSLANSLRSTLQGNSGWVPATNWDAALTTAAAGNYDIVLMVTDGAPTQSRSGGADNVRIHHVEQAVLSANAVKNGGAPVLAVGVALPDNATTNLTAISGTRAGVDYFTSGWSDLGESLASIARGLVCQATLTVNKTTKPSGGGTQTGVGGWTFTPVTQTGSQGTLAGDGTPKTTNASVNSGNVSWAHQFGAVGQTADVVFTETLTSAQLAAGWVFTSVACTNNGANLPVTKTGNTWRIDDYGVGANIRCTVTNSQTQLPADLIWTKTDDQKPAVPLGGSSWNIVGPGHPGAGTNFTDCVAAVCAGLDKDPAPGKFLLEDLAWGNYTVTETSPPAGYTGTASFTVTVDGTTAGTTINKGTFANARKLGTVIWSKISSDDDALLGGSEWKIVGPSPATTEKTIADCEFAPCTGFDVDPASGKFKVEGLAWGGYQLIETKAPFGHVLDPTAHAFSINAGNVGSTVDLGEFVNTPITPPTIPLTGGIGGDEVIIAGATVLSVALLTGLALRRRRLSTRVV